LTRGAWIVERRDSVERLVSGYNIIGRCGFGVVEVLMWYGREVVGPAPISRELSSIGAGSSLRYEILTCNLRLLAPKGQAPNGQAPEGQANIGVL